MQCSPASLHFLPPTPIILFGGAPRSPAPQLNIASFQNKLKNSAFHLQRVNHIMGCNSATVTKYCTS